jgi:hypothetical protein
MQIAGTTLWLGNDVITGIPRVIKILSHTETHFDFIVRGVITGIPMVAGWGFPT